MSPAAEDERKDRQKAEGGMQPNQSGVDLSSVSFTFSPPFHVKNLFYSAWLAQPVELHSRGFPGSIKQTTRKQQAVSMEASWPATI